MSEERTFVPTPHHLIPPKLYSFSTSVLDSVYKINKGKSFEYRNSRDKELSSIRHFQPPVNLCVQRN